MKWIITKVDSKVLGDSWYVKKDDYNFFLTQSEQEALAVAALLNKGMRWNDEQRTRNTI